MPFVISPPHAARAAAALTTLAAAVACADRTAAPTAPARPARAAAAAPDAPPALVHAERIQVQIRAEALPTRPSGLTVRFATPSRAIEVRDGSAQDLAPAPGVVLARVDSVSTAPAAQWTACVVGSPPEFATGADGGCSTADHAEFRLLVMREITVYPRPRVVVEFRSLSGALVAGGAAQVIAPHGFRAELAGDTASLFLPSAGPYKVCETRPPTGYRRALARCHAAVLPWGAADTATFAHWPAGPGPLPTPPAEPPPS